MSAALPIAAIGTIAPEQLNGLFPADLVPEARTSAAPRATETGFSDLIAKGMDEVNHRLLTSQTGLQRLATGDTQNLHQVMIQLEESRLSFQLMMQVRNRLLEAYQDVMKMQV